LERESELHKPNDPKMWQLKPKEVDQILCYRLIDFVTPICNFLCKLYLFPLHFEGEGTHAKLKIDESKVKNMISQTHTFSTVAVVTTGLILLLKQIFSPDLNTDKIIILLLVWFAVAFFVLCSLLVQTLKKDLVIFINLYHQNFTHISGKFQGTMNH